MKAQAAAILGIGAIIVFVLYNRSKQEQIATNTALQALNQSFPTFNLLYPVAPANLVGSSAYGGVSPVSPYYTFYTPPNPVYYNYGSQGQGGGLLNSVDQLLGQL